MSAAHLSSVVRESIQDQDVLAELLHLLSQPLTSLRCSLELSLDEVGESAQTTVGLALQQAERVIAMIQLMREYLDAEQPGLKARQTPLDPVLRRVVVDLASVAEARRIDIRFAEYCSAMVSLHESRLRLALQYLICVLIESAPGGGQISVWLDEGSTESALRFQLAGRGNAPEKHNPFVDSIGRVKVAIAQRILESGGIRLTIDDHRGFLLRIPRMRGASRAIV